MEYMEVLNQIIEAERVAQRIAGEAKARRDSLPDDLRALREEIRAGYLARAEHRVSAVRAQEEAIASQQIEQLDAKLADDLRALEAHFDAHKEEMVEKLFALVVGS